MAKDSLEELIDIGVTSFKIEGRLKDSNYIKNTVLYYRRALDEILRKKGLKKSSSGKIFLPEKKKGKYLNQTQQKVLTEIFVIIFYQAKERAQTLRTKTPFYKKEFGTLIHRIQKVNF